MSQDQNLNPLFLCGRQILFQPDTGFLFHFPFHIIHRIIPGRIQKDQPDLVSQGIHVAEGSFIPAQSLTGPQLSINLPILFRRDLTGSLCRLSKIDTGLLVVDIMVAGNHQDLDSGILNPGQLFCQFQMIDPLPVHGDISRKDQGIRLFSLSLFKDRIQKLRQISHYLPVALFHKFLKGAAVIRGGRRHIVKIRQEPDRGKSFFLRQAFDRKRRGDLVFPAGSSFCGAIVRICQPTVLLRLLCFRIRLRGFPPKAFIPPSAGLFLIFFTFCRFLRFALFLYNRDGDPPVISVFFQKISHPGYD